MMAGIVRRLGLSDPLLLLIQHIQVAIKSISIDMAEVFSATSNGNL